ncbi:hypothetical protein KKC32_04440 [Patescibacteria group bacterium]|nr:hypothetical protein [Patescibacteria group bacterium]
MSNENEQAIIVEKMNAAYEEFVKAINELESEGNAFIKAELAKIEKGKLAEAMQNIKNISE